MYCANCGKKINDDAKFCGYCGAQVVNRGSVQGNMPQNMTIQHAPQQSNSVPVRGVNPGEQNKMLASLGGFLACAAALVLVIVIVSGAVGKGHDLSGEWIPVSGFGAPMGMPYSMSFEKTGSSMTMDDEEQNYEQDRDNNILTIKDYSNNVYAKFKYEIEDKGILYLKNRDSNEFAMYINLEKASEEQCQQHYFSEDIYDSDDLTEYLVGNWIECDTDGNQVDGGHYFKENNDNQIQYNMPTPKHENGYRLDTENVLTVGDNDAEAFQFIPTGESTMIVYCYKANEYYYMKRED